MQCLFAKGAPGEATQSANQAARQRFDKAGLERFHLDWKPLGSVREQFHQPDSLRASSQADIALDHFHSDCAGGKRSIPLFNRMIHTLYTFRVSAIMLWRAVQSRREWVSVVGESSHLGDPGGRSGELPDQRRHHGDRHGFAEEIALDLSAALDRENFQLLRRLNPFGDRAHAQALAQAHDSANDRRAFVTQFQSANE
jgi:hypothetical protein